MQSFGLQTLRRNWHIVILGLVVTIVLAAAAFVLIPAKYVATTQVVLLPPRSQADAGYNNVVNPYLDIGALISMADVVSSAMSDDETVQALKNAGVSQYTVEYNTASAAPVLIVTAEGSSSAAASKDVTLVTNQVSPAVARLQNEASISPDSQITAQVIAGSSIPVKSDKTQIRAVGVALVCGLVLTLLGVAVIDSWRTRRRLQGPQAEQAFREPDREREVADSRGLALTGGFRPEVPVSESASDGTPLPYR